MPFDHVTVANRRTLAVSIVWEMHTQKLTYLNWKINPIHCLEFQDSFKKYLISLRMFTIASTVQFVYTIASLLGKTGRTERTGRRRLWFASIMSQNRAKLKHRQFLQGCTWVMFFLWDQKDLYSVETLFKSFIILSWERGREATLKWKKPEFLCNWDNWGQNLRGLKSKAEEEHVFGTSW